MIRGLAKVAATAAYVNEYKPFYDDVSHRAEPLASIRCGTSRYLRDDLMSYWPA